MISYSDDFSQIFRQGRRMVYQPDETLLRAGDVPSGVYYVEKGWIKAYTLCNDGEQNIVTSLSSGEIFPVAWAINGSVRDLSFTALDQTVVWRISREEFLNALRSNPHFAHATLQVLASDFLILVDEIDNLHYRTARERVVFRLLYLAYSFGQQDGRQICIAKHVSNEYIARSTNMTRETASREMSRLSRKGLVMNSRGTISVPDLEALKAEISDQFDKQNIGLNVKVL